LSTKIKRYQSLKNDQTNENASPTPRLLRRNSKKFKIWFKGLHLLNIIEMINSKMDKFKKIYGKNHLTIYATASPMATISMPNLNKSPHKGDRSVEIKISVTTFQEQDSLIVAITDITQRDLLSRLEGVNEYKINLLASFSHELRTPLNGNMSFLEAALQHPDLDNTLKNELLVPALRCSRLLFYIISDILDYSQFSLNKISLKFSKFYVKNLVNSILELFSMQAEQKGIRISSKIPDDLEITTDGTRLSQVLVNLVSNAIKFTYSGFVCVQASRSEQSIRFDVIDTGIGIQESTAAKLEKILKGSEENERISDASTGANLGLSVAAKLAILLSPNRASGVNFEKNFTGGTNFYFFVEDKKMLQNQKSIVDVSLSGHWNQFSSQRDNLTEEGGDDAKDDFIPLPKIQKILSSGAALSYAVETLPTLPDEAHADKVHCYDSIGVMSYLKQSKAKDKKELMKLMSMKSMKSGKFGSDHTPKLMTCQCEDVLIVDDDGFNLAAAASLLQTFGVSSQRAFNGQIAIQMIESKQKCHENCKLFKFILMDINMPVMNGYEATKYLREKMHKNEIPYIPIIACTAFVTHFDSKECFESGMDDYITKPLTKEKLSRLLQKWGRKKTLMLDC